MSTWGFIGSGNIGSTVAGLAVAAGHEVVMSNSRGPNTLEDLVGRLGPGARAGTTSQAAAADVVVVTIPLGRVVDVDPAPLAGKLVVDTMNYYPGRDGHIAALDDQPSSVWVAEHFTGSRVVKAFNNIFFMHLASLARPAGAPDRSALPIAGGEGKDEVAALLDGIGYDAVDAGSLADSWRFQPDTPAYGLPYAADVSDWPAGAKPAGADVIRAALAQA